MFLFDFYLKILDKWFKKKFKKNEFNLFYLDYQINLFSYIISKFYCLEIQGNKKTNNSIVVLATELYDHGGHTECLKSFIYCIQENYKVDVILSKRKSSFKKAKFKLDLISKNANISGLDEYKVSIKSIFLIFNNIVLINPKCVFLFIHPNDMVMAVVCSLLKRITNIKIIFFNHASHYPCLAMRTSDLILECLPVSAYVTYYLRKIDKSYLFGLPSKFNEETIFYDNNVKNEIRLKLGVPEGYLLTMSGGPSYKFFNENNSEYFSMIYEILKEKKNLIHVIFTELSHDQLKIVDRVFGNKNIRKRLIFHKFVSNIDLYFQLCDLFIDSFPVSSALTQIDLMRNKVPSVVKINLFNSLYSFHEYLPVNFPYMFSSATEMKISILKLLDNQIERDRIANLNYHHYLSTFEGSIFKHKYKYIIENLNILDSFIQKPVKTGVYKFSLRKS